jgi:hypothetical protein
VPKIAYDGFNFHKETRAIIYKANEIIDEYQNKGYDLTLRQLYYVFISRDLFPNDDKYIDKKTGSKNNETNYKRLGDFIANGRLAGLVDWSAIVDRTRKIHKNNHWKDPQEIIDICASQFQVDKWLDQPCYCEVFVEKDALIGVLEAACMPLDVPYYACRGYNSASEIWNAGHNRFKKKVEQGKKCYVFYLGDHDPSGIDMTRDVDERINQFAQTDNDTWITVKRLALNMDQVNQYHPPPNPTKLSDTRAEDYIIKYGETCWELDALDPEVIGALITDSVTGIRDEQLWKIAVKEEEEHKKDLSRLSINYDLAIKTVKAKGVMP